ncbi:hypothetical protein [Kitasatospora sp. NPDC057500]|uniref:hypothetical protein n=1 Tax=Kitasatospora sp. NPDC057500 TaxID=3346151 RepID=UPI0036AF2B41
MFEARSKLCAFGAAGITETLAVGHVAHLAETGLGPDIPMATILEAEISAAIGQYIAAGGLHDADGAALRERVPVLLRGMLDAAR